MGQADPSTHVTEMASSFRVARRYLARAIPIDRAAIRRFSTHLEKVLEKQFAKMSDPRAGKADRPISWKEVWAIEPFEFRNVVGEKVSTKVLVVSGTNRGPGIYVPSAAVGTWRGRDVIVIQLNGSYTAETFHGAAKSGILAEHVYDLLIHEITHIADKFPVPRSYKPRKDPREKFQPADMRAYFNDPKEVRAYMQQIVDEVLNIGGRRGPAKIIETFGSRGVGMLLRNSVTWREIEKFLNPRNRKLIMKSVYQALEEAGALASGT